MPQYTLVILSICAVLIYGAVAWATIVRYRRTRNVGFLILAAGILVWPSVPFLSRVTGLSIEDPLTGLAAGFGATVGETVVFVSLLSRLVQGSLILAGILLIGRSQAGERRVPLT